MDFSDTVETFGFDLHTLLFDAALDQGHRQKMDALRSEQDFDSTYVSMQVKAHEQAIALFQNYAQNGDNSRLQQFARDTLPTLKEHKEDITALSRGTKFTR